MISQPPLRCDDLAAVIVADPCPLLFLDTAAVLDVLRVAYRFELQSDLVASAGELIEGTLRQERRVWLVTTSNVIREYSENRDSVAGELESRLRELSLSLSRIAEIGKLVMPECSFNPTQFHEAKFAQGIVTVAEGLLRVAAVFEGDDVCIRRARDRVIERRPPASKAKQEFKDCEIFEEFLQLMTCLRSAGFEPPRIFVSPNERDYGPPPTGYPQIATELAAVGAVYVRNLSWARAICFKGR